MPLSDFYPDMKGWKEVTSTVTAAPTAPLPDAQNTQNPFLRCNLPLTLQYQPDTLRQFIKPGLSSFRTAPLPPNALPTINAAAATTASKVAHQIVSSQAISIALDMPGEFDVKGSPTGAVGTFDVTWGKELANTVFAGPAAILGGGYIEGGEMAVQGGLASLLTYLPATPKATAFVIGNITVLSGTTVSSVNWVNPAGYNYYGNTYAEGGTWCTSDWWSNTTSAGAVFSPSVVNSTLAATSPVIAAAMVVFNGLVSVPQSGGNYQVCAKQSPLSTSPTT